MTRTAAAAFLSLTLSLTPAYANENTAAPAEAPAAIGPIATKVVWGEHKEAATRPALLSTLYVSYAALQAYDVYSTKQALALGAREANPLMKGVVGNTGAFIALKAGVAAATIVAAERLWKTNKPAAIAVMIAGNSVAAIVAARNARTLGQLR